MKRIAIAASLSICLAAATALAGVGDLKYVPYKATGRTVGTMYRRPLYSRTLSAAPSGCGTVHPNARVATLTTPAGKLMVALDAAKADAKDLDLLRLDVTGKGDFNGKPTIPMKLTTAKTYKRWKFGPATVKIPVGKGTAPAQINGMYYERGESYRYVYLIANMSAQGSCRFGKKVFGVQLTDSNGNLRLGDAPTLTVVKSTSGPRKGRVAGGDMIQIDTSGAEFKNASLTVGCGQRIEVDGAWYQVDVSAGGMKIAAAPRSDKTGKVLIPHGAWSATLLGEKHRVEISGQGKPVDVPADKYVLANYRETIPSDVSSKPHTLSLGRSVLSGLPGLLFEVEPGKTATLAVGTPLQATVSISQSGENVRFNALVLDAAGTRVDSLYGPKGRPPVPTITIYNDKKEKVYGAALKYG